MSGGMMGSPSYLMFGIYGDSIAYNGGGLYSPIYGEYSALQGSYPSGYDLGLSLLSKKQMLRVASNSLDASVVFQSTKNSGGNQTIWVSPGQTGELSTSSDVSYDDTDGIGFFFNDQSSTTGIITYQQSSFVEVT